MLEQSSSPPPVSPPEGRRQTVSSNFTAVGSGKVGIALLTAILAVSTASLFIRFAQEDVPSLVIAALRLTFATLMLAPIALTRHRHELQTLTRRDVILGLVAG